MECGEDHWPWVVVAQWLEHWRLKPVTWVRFPAAARFFSTFPFSTCVSINILLKIDFVGYYPTKVYFLPDYDKMQDSIRQKLILPDYDKMPDIIRQKLILSDTVQQKL